MHGVVNFRSQQLFQSSSQKPIHHTNEWAVNMESEIHKRFTCFMFLSYIKTDWKTIKMSQVIPCQKVALTS